MKILLLLPLLLGFSVPAIAHNEFNGGEEGEGAERAGTENDAGVYYVPNVWTEQQGN